MTDHLDPLDELASAHLDGQATSAEVARIAADPELAARVERLAAARDAVRSADTPIDRTRREQAIAAAMAAFAEDAGDSSTAVGVATVTALVPAAARWRGRPRRTLGLVGIAAAVALLALAVPLIDRLDSGSEDDLAAPLGETSDDMALRDGGAADRSLEAAPDSALSETPQVGTPDLGSFSHLPDLADAVRSRLEGGVGASASAAATESSPTASGDSTYAPPAPCAEEQDASGPILYTALAELAERLVVVMVREEPDGGRTLVVLDRQDCSTVTAGRL